MKTPQIWITIGKRGFPEDNFKKIVDYKIAGVRLNTGRCPYEWVYVAIEALDKLHYPLSQILLDIGNTKPRLNLADKKGIDLKIDTRFRVSGRMGQGIHASLRNHCLFDEIAVGDIVYFGDGDIEAEVEEVDQATVVLRSLSTGILLENVAMGIKGKDFFYFHIDESEISAVHTLLSHFPVSLILSFVENGNNVAWAKETFPNAASIIPKIESASAVIHIESILAQADTILIGRGDLALSVGIEKTGMVQKQLIAEAKRASCKIAIGTGTLDSLKWSETPSRSEIIDITNSCLEGVDYIALTSETGGSFTPFKSIDFLKRILAFIKTV
jgi:pyruvate kinase